jgi:hypothetical protein
MRLADETCITDDDSNLYKAMAHDIWVLAAAGGPQRLQRFQQMNKPCFGATRDQRVENTTVPS